MKDPDLYRSLVCNPHPMGVESISPKMIFAGNHMKCLNLCRKFMSPNPQLMWQWALISKIIFFCKEFNEISRSD